MSKMIRLAAFVAIGVLAIPHRSGAPSLFGEYTYRDGVPGSARVTIPSHGVTFRSRLSPGDVDHRCDNVCHIVLCQCPAFSEPNLCRRTLTPDCEPIIVALPVGQTMVIEAASHVRCLESRRCRNGSK